MNDIYISDFLVYLSNDLNYSDNTINSYNNNLTKFNDFINKKDMEGITLAFTALKYMTKQTKKIKLDVNKLANVLAEVI